jgi:cephalosporin hydroxylase
MTVVTEEGKRTACVLASFRQNVAGAVKIVEDLGRYRIIAERVRPAVVVECGTGTGMSAVHFTSLGCRVVTVDLDPVSPAMASLWGQVVQIIGDSTAPETIRHVTDAVGGARPVLVCLDSDHSAAHVRAEMEAYGPLVSPGSYMVVEDTVLSWFHPGAPLRSLYEGTPMEAVRDFLAEHPEWEVDTEIEDMWPATQHPGGFLRRIA